MAVKPRVAQAVVCATGTCYAGHMLVRGDRISFVSVEQVRRTGWHPRDERRMPSDITAPEDFVVVHDTTGALLSRCDFHIVRWSPKKASRHPTFSHQTRDDVMRYFGDGVRVALGSIDIPEGPWRPIGKIAVIRYRRIGKAKIVLEGQPGQDEHDPEEIVVRNFEHKYDPSVSLLYSHRPLAWRLPLPEGCIVDERGFVRP